MGKQAPDRTHPLLVGEKALIVGGLGAFSGFFIPGLPELLRFWGHYKHIPGKALPKLRKHMAVEGLQTHCPHGLEWGWGWGVGMQSPSTADKGLVSYSFFCLGKEHPWGGRGLWEVCSLGSLGPSHKEVSGHWVGPQHFLPFCQTRNRCAVAFTSKVVPSAFHCPGKATQGDLSPDPLTAPGS